MLSVLDVERSNSSPKQVPEELALIQAAGNRAELLHRKPQAFTCEDHQVIRRGEWALQQLLEAHRGLILRLVAVYRSKGYNSETCDLQQEATLAFFDSVVTYNPTKGAKLSTWAYFQIRASLQKLTGANIHEAVAAARVMQSESAISKPEPIQEQGLVERLRSIIHELSQKQQQVVTLHLEGWSWSEIAVRVQSTSDAVRMRWNRALQRLRLLLVPVPIAEECEEAEVIEPQPAQQTQHWGAPLLRRLFQNISEGLLCFRSLKAVPAKTYATSSEDSVVQFQQRGQNFIGALNDQTHLLSKLQCAATLCLESDFACSDGVRGSPI